MHPGPDVVTDAGRHQAALAGRNWHYVAQASSPRSSGCRDAASFPSCAPRGQGPCGCARGTPFTVGGGLFPQRLHPSRPRLFSGYESPAYILLQAVVVIQEIFGVNCDLIWRSHET